MPPGWQLTPARCLGREWSRVIEDSVVVVLIFFVVTFRAWSANKANLELPDGTSHHKALVAIHMCYHAGQRCKTEFQHDA